MPTFNLKASEVIQKFGGVDMRMIRVLIDVTGGKFDHRAVQERVFVTDGNNSITSFLAYLSGNMKELNAFFTTDGFLPFHGSVEVQFPYQGEGQSLPNINLNAILVPLPQFLGALGAPDADNAWLANS